MYCVVLHIYLDEKWDSSSEFFSSHVDEAFLNEKKEEVRRDLGRMNPRGRPVVLVHGIFKL